MLPNIGFHDSALLSTTWEGTSLLLDLRGVQLPRGRLLDLAECRIRFDSVRDLAIDGNPRDLALPMESPQGEVDDILEQNGFVTLVVFWPGGVFPSPQSAYTFKCDSISCELSTPYETIEWECG
jgi:hypothetical protein